MKVKLIIISIILLLGMVFASGCIPVMEKLGLVSPTDEEQLTPEKGGPPDGLVKVLIGFKEKPGAAQQAMVKGVGGQIKYTYHIVDAIAASIPEKAIDALQKNPNVRYVELDGLVFALVQTLPWGVDRIDAEIVHASEPLYNKGAGVKVAIIDTGIDENHEDLNVAGGESFVDYTSDYSDDNGHGTHVAGTVAAMDNDFGVVGVAPAADLYALKVLDERGRGYVSDIVAAIEWAIDPDGNSGIDDSMDIINMSLGGGASLSLEEVCQLAYDKGLLLVASAGNSGNPPGIGDNVGYPAAYYSVIAVAATDQNDERARWSSTGPAVELAAPGVSIYSTYKDGGYATYSGTSMAAPHVAGVAALVIGSGIDDTDGLYGMANEVRELLSDTAQDIGLFFEEQGNGLVDAENAVLGTTGGDDLPSTATGTISGTVTDIDTEEPIEVGLVTANGHSTSTDSNGIYTLADLPVDSYIVTASADGYESASKEVTVIENDTSTVNFTLTLSETGTMYVESIVFSSKVAGPNKFLYTTVKVVDGNEQPLGGVSVEITLTRESGGTWYFDGDTKTDGTVKFTLAKAPSGSYIATVTGLTLSGYNWEIELGETSASCTLK